VFLCVGNLDANKNVLCAADCVDAFRRRYEFGELWLAGDGPLRGALAHRTAVRLLGSVAPDDVAPLMRTAAAGLHLSLNEGFPVAPLEFIANGVPLVATSNAVSEAMPEEAGRVVPHGDIDATVAAMRAALDLPRATPSGRAFAERYSTTAMAARLAEHLQQALDEGSRGS
jgi:glycosyltransferase involved in cell wall biosynthesis